MLLYNPCQFHSKNQLESISGQYKVAFALKKLLHDCIQLLKSGLIFIKISINFCCKHIITNNSFDNSDLALLTCRKMISLPRLVHLSHDCDPWSLSFCTSHHVFWKCQFCSEFLVNSSDFFSIFYWMLLWVKKVQGILY